MDFQHIVNNIRKLMSNWNFSLSELSVESGITINGLKHMFENGKFKIDSLNKIAAALKVPTVVLFANEISIKDETMGVDENMEMTILWKVKDINQKIESELIKKNIGFAGDYFTLNVNYHIKAKDVPQTDIDTWRAKYLKLEEKYENVCHESAHLRIEKMNTDETISILRSKASHFKDQAESYQLINEQLRETIKDMKKKIKE